MLMKGGKMCVSLASGGSVTRLYKATVTMIDLRVISLGVIGSSECFR